jgi:hypothetical protein
MKEAIVAAGGDEKQAKKEKPGQSDTLHSGIRQIIKEAV